MKVSRSIETARLRELFDYDPQTGIFTRKTGPRRGLPAGTVDMAKRGYIRLTIPNGDGTYLLLYAHRCAWQHYHGTISQDMQIDHVNGDRTDNRMANLRLATPRQNQRNYSIPIHNTSGVKGVSYDKKRNRWQAQIRIEGGRIRRLFRTIEEASDWYEKMAAEHFGEFAKPANDNRRQSEAS